MEKRVLMCGVVVVVLGCLVAGTAGQRQRVFTWNVKDYPDPFSYDTYTNCGRHNKSNICDPNGLIRRETADRIDRLIWGIFRNTMCDCRQCKQNSHGYVIRVAVMPRMERILNKGNTTEDMLREAQMYAYVLTGQWAMGGSCNESVLILFSRYDGILYTLTLPLARTVLKDEHVKRITMSVRHLFDNDDTIGDGLLEMIERYKLIFLGQEKVALRPKLAPQRSNHAPTLSPSFTTTTALLLSTLFLALSR